MYIERCVVDDDLIDRIRSGLKEYSLNMIGFGSATESHGFRANIGGRVVGASVVEEFLNELYIKYLYVDRDFRRMGVGTGLMNGVFAFAKEKGAGFVTVTTLSFQAPDFYKLFGFEVEFVRRGYENGISKYYFKKKLTDANL